MILSDDELEITSVVLDAEKPRSPVKHYLKLAVKVSSDYFLCHEIVV